MPSVAVTLESGWPMCPVVHLTLESEMPMCRDVELTLESGMPMCRDVHLAQPLPSCSNLSCANDGNCDGNACHHSSR